MTADDVRLSLMTFPQRVEGRRLVLRILCAPTRDPLAPLVPDVAAFCDLALPVEVRLLPTLEDLPTPGAGELLATPSLGPVATARPVLEALGRRLPVDPSVPPADPGTGRLRVYKVATEGYLQAAGASRLGSSYLVDSHRYACAMRDALDPAKRPTPPPPRPGLRWNEILGRALRQPLLAHAVGLVHEVTVDLPEGTSLDDGAFLWVEAAAGSPLATAATTTPDLLRLYAARVPRLPDGAARQLLAAVLFPVRQTPPAGSYDLLFAEAEAYSDGFAKVVHATQPDRHDPHRVSHGAVPLRPVSDGGVRLGWDDEQLLEWMNRQFAEDPRNGAAGQPSRDAPLGVMGWRVDVREAGADDDAPWVSLVRAAGELTLEDVPLGRFDGDLSVETPPTVQRHQPLAGGATEEQAWMTPEAARWSGGSLLGGDELRRALAGGGGPVPALVPDPVSAVPLRYGGLYEFRVRGVDLTGGGPPVEAHALGAARHGVAQLRFRRFVPPRDLVPARQLEVAGQRRVVLNVSRPTIGAPDALFLPGDLDARRAALLAAATADGPGREPHVVDTDVTMVRLDFTVAMTDGDPANLPGTVSPRQPLFGGPVVRRFPEDPEAPLQVICRFVDVTSVDQLPPPSDDGDIVLPTSRDVFLEATPVARPDPAMDRSEAEDPALVGQLPRPDLTRRDAHLEYYGNQAARIGSPTSWTLRQPAVDESALLLPAPGVPPLAAVLVAPPRGGEPSAAVRLAAALRLAQQGMTLSGRAGTRTLLSCSSRLSHLLSPDRGSLTLGSEAELVDRWLVAVRLTLDRDWSWDGLSPTGLAVWRTEEDGTTVLAGRVTDPRAVSRAASEGEPDRRSTSVLFLDVVDPVTGAGPPSERHLRYAVEPELAHPAEAAAPQPWTGEIRLPVAAPPQDEPAIVSAGVAATPYEHSADYSASSPRQRVLWLELAAPPVNPADVLYGRVLHWSPDPVLTGDLPAARDGDDPALVLPEEPVRLVVPDQADDRAGEDAMQPLVPTRSPTVYVLPLPPGVEPGSPQLFGFYRYELRVGHGPSLWSTARARFGPALRMDGLRHPPPTLDCSAERLPASIVAHAPYARVEGPDAPIQVRTHHTDLWFLLYAQVTDVAGAGVRNLLLDRRRGHLTDPEWPPPPRLFAKAQWELEEVRQWLDVLALDPAAGLSVLAVEMMPAPRGPQGGELFPDPLAGDLGEVAMLRSSPLVAVPSRCSS
ncbi:hypothetical protein SAMN05216184_101331 [Georgenia satyanarayanai]|uniref:Uncharacterized protein n=1 Tax=Georgenia satyanarayanai TaxID=860221 RepID=A0A2Y9A2E6_9MICO|nr:hypothetical protein [Georgenia satyanarayanai]PYG01866.1 hypothetical protein A8987_101331 [Georgenia satyanarayanai]SSA36669.1 hypothetical protein SAMN05216184_101331 [Georgenia satyanarayanai]